MPTNLWEKSNGYNFLSYTLYDQGGANGKYNSESRIQRDNSCHFDINILTVILPGLPDAITLSKVTILCGSLSEKSVHTIALIPLE